MKKKQRQMIGMLLALVVLAAAFLGIRQYNKNASPAASTTEGTQETVLLPASAMYMRERPMPLKKRMTHGTMRTIIP